MAKDRVLWGIPPESLAETYRTHELHRLSDLELFEAAIDVVAVPKKNFSSYTMHAPLELLARYSLLPYVRPSLRELARMQLAATAAYYESMGGEAKPSAAYQFVSLEEAKQSLVDSISAGHMDQAQASATYIAANIDADHIRRLFCDLFLARLSSGAHSHIFLHLASRVGVGMGISAARMLPGFSRELARNPHQRIEWAVSEIPLQDSQSPGKFISLEDALLKVAPVERPSTGGIYAIINQAEQLGLPQRYLSSVLPDPDASLEQINESFATACRVALLSMLQERTDHAKYGWTHCLTLPQAAWALLSSMRHVDVALRIASTYVTGFRAAIGRQSLTESLAYPDPGIGLSAALRQSPAVAAAAAWHVPQSDFFIAFSELASEASIRNDCHLVKYTLACFDAAMADPTHKRLYLAGAAYLAALWILEQPESSLEENLHKRE